MWLRGVYFPRMCKAEFQSLTPERKRRKEKGKKKDNNLYVVFHVCNPSTEEVEAEDPKFKVTIGYRVSSRLA